MVDAPGSKNVIGVLWVSNTVIILYLMLLFADQGLELMG